MDQAIAFNVFGLKGYSLLSDFLLVAALLLILFILSVFWAVRDARKHDLPGLFAVLVLTFTGWPISILWWVVLRVLATRFFLRSYSARFWQKAVFVAVALVILWGAGWRMIQTEFAVMDRASLEAAFVNRDVTPILGYLQLAAEAGSPLAQINLGLAYYEGMGVRRDLAEADSWFHEVERQQNALPLYYLGRFFEEGQGVSRNYVLALDWYRKAAKLGHAEAMRSISRMYREGIGVEQDDEEAEKWYRAALQNTPEDDGEER
jgi:hypothetical protein